MRIATARPLNVLGNSAATHTTYRSGRTTDRVAGVFLVNSNG